MLNQAILAIVFEGCRFAVWLAGDKAAGMHLEAAAGQSSRLPRRYRCKRLRDGIAMMQAEHLNQTVGATDAHREKPVL